MRDLLGDATIVLTPETRPADVPGWDSLANVSIVFAVEEEFGVRFADEDLGPIESAGGLAGRVDRALASRAAT